MLHQIRRMMSATVGILKGIIPPLFISVALDSPFKFRLPLIPPNYLILADAKFQNAKRQPIPDLFPDSSRTKLREFYNTTLLPHVQELHFENKYLDNFVENYLPLCKVDDWDDLIPLHGKWLEEFAIRKERAKIRNAERKQFWADQNTTQSIQRKKRKKLQYKQWASRDQNRL